MCTHQKQHTQSSRVHVAVAEKQPATPATPRAVGPAPQTTHKQQRRRQPAASQAGHRYDSGFHRWRKPSCLSLSRSPNTSLCPSEPNPTSPRAPPPPLHSRPPNARAARRVLTLNPNTRAYPAPRGVVQDGALRPRLRRRGSRGRGREAEPARGVHGDARDGAGAGAGAAPAVPVLGASVGALALPPPPPRPLDDAALHRRRKVSTPTVLRFPCSFSEAR